MGCLLIAHADGAGGGVIPAPGADTGPSYPGRGAVDLRSTFSSVLPFAKPSKFTDRSLFPLHPSLTLKAYALTFVSGQAQGRACQEQACCGVQRQGRHTLAGCLSPISQADMGGLMSISCVSAMEVSLLSVAPCSPRAPVQQTSLQERRFHGGIQEGLRNTLRVGCASLRPSWLSR